MTLNEVVNSIADDLQSSDREYILNQLKRGASIQDIAIEGHHGLGRAIRNKFRLWDDAVSGELKTEIWNTMPQERRDYLTNYWGKHGKASRYVGPNMHADDASNVIIEMVIERVKNIVKKPETNLSVHLSHCNFGEHVNSCKYGDENCPALTDEWSWFGWIVQDADKMRDKIQVLEEKIEKMNPAFNENRRKQQHVFDEDGFCYYCQQWKYDERLLPEACIVAER